MKIKLFITASLIAFSVCATSQVDTQINKTDQQGRKQGHWVKRYPDETIMYEGFFKNDHPVGEFKRYYENKSLKSILIYSDDGKKATASIFHPNGNISSKGIYVDQKKEGKWQFFSATAKGYLISEEFYVNNLRNGLSVKFYPDSTIADKITYVNNVKQGEWIQYYPSGAVWLKTNFRNGKINGSFEVWFANGAIEYSGNYKDDSRDGKWVIYNIDGSVKYRMEYSLGITRDMQMDIDESNFLDSLENNRGKIADPEKTGVLK